MSIFCENEGLFGGQASASAGEIISSTIDEASAVILLNNIVSPIAIITLSAGDWQIKANPQFICNSVGIVTSLQAFIGTSSGTSTEGRVTGNTAFVSPPSLPGTGGAQIVWDVNIDVETTYYLKGLALFPGGSVNAFGELSARKMS